nr:MFS transporter [Paenibacillus hamazuiensis]
MCFVLFFSVMNATMFNVALPDIAADFSLSPSAVSWIVTGYSVIYALGSLLFGKLADKYPLKRLITIGLLLFAAASAFGFFANSYALVLIARFVQAAGASCVPALVMLIPVRFFQPEQRGKVMGVIASTIAFSSGLGPIIGGFIAGHLGWNYLFLISLAAPVVLPLIRRSLPEEQVRSGEKVDLVGAALLGGGVAAFMLAVTQFSALWLLGSVVLTALFLWRTGKSPNPFIQLRLFYISGFVNGLVVSFTGFFTVFGVFLLTPIMLKGLYNLDAQTIGFVLFPAAMLAALLGRVGGQLADRRGSKYTLYVALTMLAFGLLCLSAVNGLSPWIIACALPFVNVAFTFMQASLAKAVSSSLPREQTGIGMGVYNLVNFLAGAISGSVLTKAIEFDASSLNFTSLGQPTTFGAVYFVLGLLALADMLWVFWKLERKAVAVPTMGK